MKLTLKRPEILMLLRRQFSVPGLRDEDVTVITDPLSIEIDNIPLDLGETTAPEPRPSAGAAPRQSAAAPSSPELPRADRNILTEPPAPGAEDEMLNLRQMSAALSAQGPQHVDSSVPPNAPTNRLEEI